MPNLLNVGDQTLYPDWFRRWTAERPAPVVGNSVVIMGDSIQQNAKTIGAASSYFNTIGCFSWANAFMGQRLNLVDTFAVGGQSAGAHTDNSLRTNLQTYLSATSSEYVSVLIGTNDIAADRTYQQLINDLDYIFKSIVDSGRIVLGSTILPRLSGGSGLSATQRRNLLATNAWLRELNYNATGVSISDPFRHSCDPTSATSDPFAGETYDSSTVGLHPAPAMAMRVGEVWAADWGQIVPAYRHSSGGAGDIYHSADNPFGNLTVNGGLQSLSATSGTGFAGNNPANFTVQRLVGAGTWTGSAVARTDGMPGNWYRAAITGESNASAQYQMRQNVFGPQGGGTDTYAIGDIMFGELDVKVTHTGSTNYVKGIYVSAVEYDRDANVVMAVAGLYRYSGTNPLQRAKDYTATLRTPNFITSGSAGVGAASQRITISADVIFDGSVSAALTIDMADLRLRKLVG